MSKNKIKRIIYLIDETTNLINFFFSWDTKKVIDTTNMSKEERNSLIKKSILTSKDECQKEYIEKINSNNQMKNICEKIVINLEELKIKLRDSSFASENGKKIFNYDRRKNDENEIIKLLYRIKSEYEILLDDYRGFKLKIPGFVKTKIFWLMIIFITLIFVGTSYFHKDKKYWEEMYDNVMKNIPEKILGGKK